MSKKKGCKREVIPVGDLELEGSTQVRVHTDPQVVSEYSSLIERDGWVFPEVIVFRDKAGRNWLGDGFHRIAGGVGAGLPGIPSEVREGGIKDALRYALGANCQHGLRRNPEDIRKAVEIASYEFPDLTDRAVAHLVKCSPPTVAKYRPAETQCGAKTSVNGRVFVEGSRASINAREDEDYKVENEPVREDVVGAETGSEKVGDPDAVADYDLNYVELDGKPGIAEVEAWVIDIPTWRVLSDGSEIPVKRMKNDCGVPSNMIRRELVISWCAACPKMGDDIPRWSGFRARPVSLEHAERERKKWGEQSRLNDEIEWLRNLTDLVIARWDDKMSTLIMGVLARQVLKHVTTESVSLVSRAAGVDVDEFSERIREGGGELIDVIGMLLGTELHGRGHEELETDVLEPVLSYLES
ncbi:MAG: hypothetical protein ACPG32_04515 [Akkermansiaceae bacterium]